MECNDLTIVLLAAQLPAVTEVSTLHGSPSSEGFAQVIRAT